MSARLPAFIVLALVCVNFIAGRYGGYPVFYCWFSPELSDLYMAWGSLALYACAAFIIWNAVMGGLNWVMVGCAVFFCIIHFPDVAAMVFNIGGGCG